MNTIRMAAGVLWVLLASQTCPLAIAQFVGRPVDRSGGGLDPHERDPLPADVAVETSHVLSDFYRIAQGWRRDKSIGDLPEPEPQQNSSQTAVIEEPTSTALDDCCNLCRDNARPSIYGQVEALFLWRESRLIGQPIIVDANTGETFMSSSDLNSDFAPGVRATFGTRTCSGWALEFSYLGLFQGTGSAQAVSPGTGAFLIFPDNFFGNVFVGLDLAQASYSSALNSFEANLPRGLGCDDQCCDDCACGQVRSQTYEWFTGFRYINVDEDLNILAQGTVAGATEEGNYDIHTNNNLFGLQLGARTRRMRGRFGWEATGKTGIFANNARQRQSVNDFPDFPIRPDVSSSSTSVASLGEVDLSAIYQLDPVWNLRAGYTALWIDGLALAPDQLDFDFASATGGEQLHNGGAIFLHGITAGIEARW
jgi:hypothetical protein